MKTVPYLRIGSPSSGGEKYLSYRCTVSNPPFPEKSDVTLYPPGKSIQIKGIDRKSEKVTTVSIKGVASRAVQSGALILPSSYPAAVSTVSYGVFLDGDGKVLPFPQLRSDLEAVLESSGLPLRPVGRSTAIRVHTALKGRKLVTDKAVLFCVAHPYTIRISRETPATQLTFLPIFTEEAHPQLERKIMDSLVRLAGRIEESDVYALRREVLGYTAAPKQLRSSFRENAGERELPVLGHFLVDLTFGRNLRSDVLRLIQGERALSVKDIAALKGVEKSLIEALVAVLIREGLVLKEGQYLLPVKRSGEQLSPAVRSFLNILRDRGISGVDLKAPESRKFSPFVEILLQKGYALALEGDVLISKEAYQETVKTLLAGKSPGSVLSIQDAKARLRLSRKYIIPLMERMKEDNLLTYEGRVAGTADSKPYRNRRKGS